MKIMIIKYTYTAFLLLSIVCHAINENDFYQLITVCEETKKAIIENDLSYSEKTKFSEDVDQLLAYLKFQGASTVSQQQQADILTYLMNWLAASIKQSRNRLNAAT